jgi:glycosyltransferase involved in cell wall biosynthesis
LTSTEAISVCHIISGDLWAGAEVQVASLLRVLRRQEGIRLSAIVLNEGRLARELHDSDIEVMVAPEEGNSLRQILRAVAPWVRAHRVQVLHSHRYKENLLAHLLAWQCGIPVTVRTQHGMPEPFHGIKAGRQALTGMLDRWTGRHLAKAVISVSAEMTPKLRRRFGNPVVEIHNGIDTACVRSELTKGEAKQRLGFADGMPLIGIVGRIEAIKRVDLFLKMARLLIDFLPGARFVVAGDGSLRQPMTKLAHEMGLSERVFFAGHRNDISDLLRALDVLVICSEHEGMPMVLLEAMWLGVPVVARAVGGMVEVLGEDVNGLSVRSANPEDLAAACVQLVQDDTLCERLRQSAARTVAERYSVEGTAKSVLSLYRRLCGR